MGSTILLADDSLTIQKVVELTFSDTGHEVVAVSSGEELLQRLPETKPDVVICDILMPGTDGYEVCQRIKSSPASLHIPVILLTGTFEPFDRDRALAAGCSEIITKPFEARKLVESVERLLAGDATGPRPTGQSPQPEAGAPSQFHGAVPPPAPSEAGEAFETRLAPPNGTAGDAGTAAAGDELEFTSSGFAEMAAAGDADQAAQPMTPDEGLEFDVDQAPGDAALDDGFEDAFDDQYPADDGFEDEPPATEEPFASNEVTADFPPQAAIPSDDEPFGEEPAAPAAAAATTPDSGQRSGEDTWPDISDTATGVADAFGEDDSEAEIAPMPMPATAEATVAAATDGDLGDDEDDGADTAPIIEPQVSKAVTPPPAPAPPAAAAVPASTGNGSHLSDEDIDRIARRVLELAADRIEQIAWDVVPDMAEIVVRERIRELETAADAAPDA